MKKYLALLTLLGCLLLPQCLAEEANLLQETLITAPYDEADDQPGLIISSLESDHAVRLYGVESDAIPCTYQSFSQTFIRFMDKNFEYAVALTGPYYSDGYWVYMMFDGSNAVLIKIDGETPEALVSEILIMGDAEYPDDVATLSAACMFSAAKCGQYGQFAMNLLFAGQGVENYLQYTCDYWQENGFLLSFGTNEYGLPWGKITYEEASLAPPPVDFQMEYVVPIENGPTLGDFSEYLNKYAPWLMLDAPVLPETYEFQGDYRMYSSYWEDCAVTLFADPESEQITHIAIASLSYDTTSLWGRTCLLYAAASQAPEEDFFPLMMLTGGSGGWDLLSSMQPYVYWQGIMLQCMADDALAGAPYAIICGADSLP